SATVSPQFFFPSPISNSAAIAAAYTVGARVSRVVHSSRVAVVGAIPTCNARRNAIEATTPFGGERTPAKVPLFCRRYETGMVASARGLRAGGDLAAGVRAGPVERDPYNAERGPHDVGVRKGSGPGPLPALEDPVFPGEVRRGGRRARGGVRTRSGREP